MKTGNSALQYEGVANRHDVECALARLHNNLINNLTSQSDVPILMAIICRGWVSGRGGGICRGRGW